MSKNNYTLCLGHILPDAKLMLGYMSVIGRGHLMLSLVGLMTAYFYFSDGHHASVSKSRSEGIGKITHGEYICSRHFYHTDKTGAPMACEIILVCCMLCKIAKFYSHFLISHCFFFSVTVHTHRCHRMKGAPQVLSAVDAVNRAFRDR